MHGKLTKALTRLLLATALLGAMPGAGFAATSGRAECPMSRLHGCCKKARAARDADRVAPAARLCCVVNCPQPAPTGANFTLRPSPGEAGDPRPPAAVVPVAPAAERARAYSPPFQPSHSPPAYVQHSAFLI